jgi:hypothetical protein
MGLALLISFDAQSMTLRSGKRLKIVQKLKTLASTLENKFITQPFVTNPEKEAELQENIKAKAIEKRIKKLKINQLADLPTKEKNEQITAEATKQVTAKLPLIVKKLKKQLFCIELMSLTLSIISSLLSDPAFAAKSEEEKALETCQKMLETCQKMLETMNNLQTFDDFYSFKLSANASLSHEELSIISAIEGEKLKIDECFEI